MSQRQGPPQSIWSRLFLKCMAWLMCQPELNEWQQVWDTRDDLHHGRAPPSQGRYSGHACLSGSCRWDLETHPLQPTVVYTRR
jgi:hypothetical protein